MDAFERARFLFAEPAVPKLSLVLDLCLQSSFGLLAWLSWAHCLAGRSSRAVSVSAFESDFSIFTPVQKDTLRQQWAFEWATEHERQPQPQQAFVFVSGSRALTGKIIDRFSQIHVQPAELPDTFAADLYWSTTVGRDWLAGLQQFSMDVFGTRWYDDLQSLKDTLGTVQRPGPRVSAISSIFNGDAFLHGFLTDAQHWQGYADCEHLLIRAGSRGDEHANLLAHVRQHQNAIYINLDHDPGLYAVWNMGAQVSTAPYLTNANLDDRRAPQQISTLTEFLDQHPDVAAVSAALRMTTQANLPWVDSAECPVLFGNVGAGNYGVAELFRTEGGGAIVSRNLLHCMPVWRRQLHFIAGWFYEARYGPSADWEFWVRAGLLGQRYAYLNQPLGLFLRHDQSYWRRHSTLNFDQRIVNEYALRAQAAVPIDRAQWTLRQRVQETLAAHAANDALGTLCGLVDCALRAQSFGPDSQAAALVNAMACRFIDYAGFMTLMEQHSASFTDMADPLDNALSLAIELLHADTVPLNLVKKPWVFLLEKALVDHFLVTRLPAALCALAFMFRRLDKPKHEADILKLANSVNAIDFWSNVQRVYRFTEPLDQLAAKASSILRRPVQPTHSQTASRLKLWFFPAYKSNEYTQLLYENMVQAGAVVEGLSDVDKFSQITPDPNHANVLHLHWIDKIFKDSPSLDYEEMGARFLDRLLNLKKMGVEIRWTIHNRLSHDLANETEEISFRKKLYAAADRVYLHHPMAMSLLDWLPDYSKCHLLEHGNNMVQIGPRTNKQDARIQLGLDKNDLVFLFIGILRDYKGLDVFLPIFERLGQQHPHLKLVVAGRITSSKLKQLIDQSKYKNIIFNENYLPDKLLEVYASAADYGFLSYRSILTSGTLFHLMSAGLPVLAPALGTIPAYITNGWNGFTYADENEFQKKLITSIELPKNQIENMGRNSEFAARTLKWDFY